MRSKSTFNLICVICGLLFTFNSCKDDPVTPSAPSETLIYSFDSLSVWSSDSGVINLHDYRIKLLIEFGNKVKIEFNLESNIDSLSANYDAQLRVSDTLAQQWFLSQMFTHPYQFNKFYTFSISNLSLTIIEIRCDVAINDSYNHLLKFVRIRNFKVYKVN